MNDRLIIHLSTLFTLFYTCSATVVIPLTSSVLAAMSSFASKRNATLFSPLGRWISPISCSPYIYSYASTRGSQRTHIEVSQVRRSAIVSLPLKPKSPHPWSSVNINKTLGSATCSVEQEAPTINKPNQPKPFIYYKFNISKHIREL